jgi:hypothetical protein
MADEKLYIANYGSASLEKIVKPHTGQGLKVSVGPKSFVTVSTQEVTGPLPWHVMNSPTITALTVRSLPAIAAVYPGVLTAVVYPVG